MRYALELKLGFKHKNRRISAYAFPPIYFGNPYAGEMRKSPLIICLELNDF